MTDAVATFQNDLPAVIVGVALCTIAAGLFAFGLLGRRISNVVDLPIAGAFAALYGLRLFLRTESITMVLGDRPWLHQVHASLEYLVPVPAAILFERLFGFRLRWLTRAVTIIVVTVASIAIPYEILTRQPGALRRVDDFVVIFIAFYILNIFLPAPGKSQDWRILRTATAIFAAYVLNEHFHVVNLPFGLASEPVGFLIFIAAIVFTLIRQTVRTEMRVAAVDGELAAARQIQMSILPKALPRIRGLDLSAVYAPASEVAGDFYDFLVIDEHRVGIFVADVAGHGVPAALVASMLKVALAGHQDLARQPARLLQEFNAFFCGKLERQFITATYALIEDGTATIASAGHPPPLVVREGRTIEEVVAEGSLLGRFPSATFSERTTRIGNGDALVLYTDGIPEALSAKGEMWGDGRFHDSLARGASAEQILDAVRSWSTPLNDDVTLVVAKRVSV